MQQNIAAGGHGGKPRRARGKGGSSNVHYIAAEHPTPHTYFSEFFLPLI
jgi:hypothetical protein